MQHVFPVVFVIKKDLLNQIPKSKHVEDQISRLKTVNNTLSCVHSKSSSNTTVHASVHLLLRLASLLAYTFRELMNMDWLCLYYSLRELMFYYNLIISITLTLPSTNPNTSSKIQLTLKIPLLSWVPQAGQANSKKQE